MAVVGFLRSHLDAVVAVLLSGAYAVEVALAGPPVSGESFVTTLTTDERTAIIAGGVFLLSLATRTSLPLVPLALAYVALALLGRGPIDGVVTLLAGLVLAAYSAGAWAGGRAGQLAALLVGGLGGLAALRAATGTVEPRDLAGPVFLLVGAWLLGLAARSVRAARGDERIVGELDWETASAAPDAAARDEIVRDIRDIVERSMSAVILQSRTARASLRRDPVITDRSLGIIETAGSEALEATQRLTGLLLSPNGMPLPGPQLGLADLDELAAQVTEAGLPVDMRIEGRPVPLTPDLDAVAYRVVYEALMSTLHHATSAHSSVVVRYEPGELQVEVLDDGVGLADDDEEGETAGLMAMRDEVAALGGTLDAGPGDKVGYWVLARLPYEPDWD